MTQPKHDAVLPVFPEGRASTTRGLCSARRLAWRQYACAAPFQATDDFLRGMAGPDMVDAMAEAARAYATRMLELEEERFGPLDDTGTEGG